RSGSLGQPPLAPWPPSGRTCAFSASQLQLNRRTSHIHLAGHGQAEPAQGEPGLDRCDGYLTSSDQVAFELSAGVPASAARAPGLERETAPSSGEARRLRRRAGSHVDSKEKKKSAQAEGPEPATRAQAERELPAATARSHDLLTAEGKADVRHAHGPGSTALELCGGEASTERHGVRPPPIRLSRRWQWRTLSPPLKGRANWRRRGPPG
ncbi:unnamed protein product, partial [Prorocentrum cordatum]